MASQIIQTLITELTANGAQMRDEINQTMADTQSWGERTTRIAKGVGIGVAAAGVGAGIGLAVMVKNSIDGADALGDLSQSVGVSVEELSKLKYASDQNGTDFETLSGGMKKLNGSMADAAKGTGVQAEAFNLLGVKVKNADGSLRAVDAVFMDVADRFSKFKDGAAKSSLAVDIFSKSGADLIPMLNAGREGIRASTDEAVRFGLVVGSDMAAAAGEFNDSLGKMDKPMEGFANRVTEKAIKPLAELVKTINDPAFQEGLADISTGVINIGTSAVGSLADLSKFTQFIAEEMARTIHGVANDDIPGLQDRLQQLQAQADPKNFMDWMENSNIGDMFTGKGKLLQEIEEVKKLIEVAYSQAAKIPPAQAVVQPQSGDEKGDLSLLLARKEANEAAAKAAKKLRDEEWEDIDRVMKRDADQKLANEKLIASAQDKFDRIHAAALESDQKYIELENFRALREQQDLQKDLEFMRQQGAATAEVEQQFRSAKIELETLHQAELKKIKDDAALADLERRDMQLANAQDLFGSLSSITASFAGKNSRAYKAMFAVEKAIGVARSIVAIQAAAAQAAAFSTFPANLGAMATVAGATANIVSTIKGTPSGIAHGGLDNVPKEATYLLDKGERVLSPKQNRDITDFIAKDGGSNGVNVVVKNYGSDNVNVKQDGNTIEILIGQVINKIGDQISRGNGLASILQNTYPALNRRGVV